ncbi:MAG: hypothetical protein HPY90_07670 [Syntrophothermus sp.]|uniref:hypothetical protein n=1 Tax=Syntrophothermus sp. TaxID=2736299 RepID=UPI00257D81DB|nr:hypothetical protein [Syntrophothermus sp.]NSW83139.1 hypothetical protein [Syntrophothermus sp.]
MGGRGSGNWYRLSKKDTVEGCRSLDVNRWHREGLLRPGQWFGWAWKRDDGKEEASIGVTVLPDAIELSYTMRPGMEDAEKVRYIVPITWTECNYGGRRPWFVCPGSGCGRRVGKLYLGGKYFLCRHCYDLVYESQRENRAYRLMRKAQKIQERLGGRTGLMYSFPDKPKWMHWDTYNRLKWEGLRAKNEALMAALETFGQIKKALERT